MMIDLKKIIHDDIPLEIFKKGDVIFEDGAPSNGMMYILSEGHVDVYKNYGKQGEICVANLAPGDFFGEMSLFLNKGRTATIVARDNVSLCVINRTEILDFLSNQPEIAFSFLQALCTRIESTNVNAADNRVKYEKDINVLTNEKIELENTANTDQLTGVYNRRYFMENVGTLVEIIGRNRFSFIVMFDLDHFKDVNDTYGHPAGDHVLVTVAKTITSSIRASDIFARYGGEEFILLITCASPDHALPLVERIRQDIEKTAIEYEGQTINVTISAGIAPVDSASEIDTAAISRADKALYQAKAQGRNRSVLYTGE